jgi:membrane protein implicated in regulation of membrane protease activity
MLLVYQICCIVGGIFVVLAAVGGLDGVEFETEFEADLEVSDRAPDQERSLWSRARRPLRWLPIFTLRFWTFGIAFFGLAGWLLSVMNVAATPTLAIASLLGIVCGGGVAMALRQLRKRNIDSLVRSADYVGLSGIVEIPFDANSRGKIQLRVRGITIGLMAMTDNPNGFEAGDRVFVVSTANNRVWVIAEQDAIGDDSKPFIP